VGQTAGIGRGRQEPAVGATKSDGSEVAGVEQASFSEGQLTALCEVSNELSTAATLDELCRRAVELARSRFGIDRLAIWLIDSDPRFLVGTFGVDEKTGKIRDESAMRRLSSDSRFPGILPGGRYSILVEDSDLWNHRKEVVGRGSLIVAALWDGQTVIGYLAADNALGGRSLTAGDEQLLRFFACNLGHLCGLKRAEHVLRESEERFRNLMEYIPGVSIQGYKTDGTVFYWNKASEKVYGYTAAEALGKNLGDLIIPAQIKPHFERALEIGKTIKSSGEFMPAGELMLLHKKGHLVPVYSIHTAVYIEGSEPLLFCIDVDLSERKKAEEVLRAQKERLDLILERSFDGINIAEYDPETHKRRLVLCNDRFVEMSGRSREELMAADDLNAFQSFSVPEVVRQGWRRDIEQGIPFSGSASWIRPDGKENYYEWSAASVVRDDKIYIIGIDRDMTEHRRRDEALREQEEHLRLIMENSSDGINITKLDRDVRKLRLVMCNDRFVEMTGRSREELLAADDLTPWITWPGWTPE